MDTWRWVMWWIQMIVIVSFWVWTASAHSATIGFNFTGDTFTPAKGSGSVMAIGGGILSPGSTLAIPFTVSSPENLRLTSLEVPLVGVFTNNQVTMGIWTSVNGQPGTPLESFVSSELPACSASLPCTDGSSIPLYTFTANQQTVLAANTEYWLTGGKGYSLVLWGATTEQERFAFRNDDLSQNPDQLWRVFSGVRQGAFRIVGEPCAGCAPTVQACASCLVSVPLPASVVLFVVGVVAIATWSARRGSSRPTGGWD